MQHFKDVFCYLRQRYFILDQNFYQEQQKIPVDCTKKKMYFFLFFLNPAVILLVVLMLSLKHDGKSEKNPPSSF